jgi:TolB-like protein/Tfp pilus assembly protein PilF
MSLIAELKRRNVFRVGVAYAIVAWLLVEVASVVLPTFGAPDWVLKALTFLVILGFPLALILAWAFELTPEGIKLEKTVDRAASITKQTRRKLDFSIIGLLAVALIFVVVDNYVLEAEPEQAEAAAEQVPATKSAAREKSIAVLPFVNMSDDPANEYFSDGISEELLNALAKVTDLSVAARTSSFRFKGQDLGVGEIAEILNVAHVLEGSVRKAGNRVRITAQLIRADSGFHIWSATYDRTLDDIFAVQEEIARAIVDALKTKLGLRGGKLLAYAGTENVEAYNLYLRGRYLTLGEGAEAVAAGIKSLEAALRLDPGFARAWANLAVAYGIYNEFNPDMKDAFALADQAADEALALDASLALAHSVKAGLHLSKLEWRLAGEAFEHAVTLEPNEPTSRDWYSQYLFIVGDFEAALRQSEEALRLDPGSRFPWFQLGFLHYSMGDVEAGLKVFKQAIETDPVAAAYAYLFLAAHSQLTGDYDAMLSDHLTYLRFSGASEDIVDWARRRAAALKNPKLKAGVIDDITAAYQRGDVADAVIGLYAADLGAYDLAAQIAEDLLPKHFQNSQDVFVPIMWLSHPRFREFRKDAAFKRLLTSLRLVDYWREEGWGDLCRPLGDHDFECD